MEGLVIEMIPYKDFWDKVRIVAEYHYGKGAKVEIMDDYIYVEYREGDGGGNTKSQIG